MAGRAEAEQGHRILADLQFGQEHHVAADWSQRVERAAAGQHLIADALDINHRMVGGAFGEDSGEAGDHFACKV